MMVDLLGFDLNPSSENYISPELFNDITQWVSGVSFVGEFGGAKSDEISNIIGSYL